MLDKSKLLAQTFGKVDVPPGVDRFAGGSEQGIPILVQNLLKLMVLGAGIYALINFILAGYDFLGAGDDPKKVEGARQKITLSIIGLVVASGAFLLAAIVGLILYGEAGGIFTP